MPKNTNIQMIDNLANNFHGYAVLLRKIKQRVLIALATGNLCRQRRNAQNVLGRGRDVTKNAKTLTVGARKLCNAYPWI